MTTTADLSFLPWVRQGAAAAVEAADTLGPRQPAVASVEPVLTLNAVPVAGVTTIRLRGPADVVGIDANQVVRTDPPTATTDFEPNCFASIELDRADFPWLFTPASANANTQLRPWLCLVVVEARSGVTLAGDGHAPLPVLQIAAPATLATELPDLQDSWAWAHAQVAADETSATSVRDALNGAPELSLSRLVCPRILAPDTAYIACLVPTFDAGRKAGLGLAVRDADLATLAPAWSARTSQPLSLPVYYHWEFRTGEDGDFESLARSLTPAVPQGLGTRPIDVSHPGFDAAGATRQDMEGALAPIMPGGTPVPQPAQPLPTAFTTTLAGILNKPGRSGATTPDADPLLAPPLYGRWHVGRAAATPDGATWFDQVNLDPRWRVAAAFGTRVVQEHQEALMASAWEQAAELPTANQRLRQLQLSLAVGEVIHARHFSSAGVTEETILRLAAPAFGRLRQTRAQLGPGPAPSLLTDQAGSTLPLGANRSAMRRVGRLRGPLSRRTAAQHVLRSAENSWVARLNDMGGDFPPPPSVPAPPDFCVLPSLPIAHLGDNLSGDSSFGAFFVASEHAPVVPAGEPCLVLARTEVPGLFRTAAVDHIGAFLAPRPSSAHGGQSHHHRFLDIKPLVIEQTRPGVALAALVSAVISTGDGVLAPTADGVAPSGMETILAAPSFPQPMYESLRDLSQDLLLPGLDTVAPNTVLGLRTNRRFVEAYMVGLNHEMGRELLWRGYPTDQRGTYFAHFWGAGVPNSAPDDIAALNTWNTRPLGSAEGAPVLTEEFVMMVRSTLLRRYPNTVIYLTPAIRAGAGPDPTALVPDEDPDHEVPPLFSGSMQPDVCFFGFPVTTEAAIGKNDGDDLGYYVIVQEHPTEPRFGLDADLPLPGRPSHLPIGAQPPPGLPLDQYLWGRNAAHMAGITRRLPVRMAIHAARLITPAESPDPR